ncbi:allophanate hydrolase [Pararhizobium sp.]|uniref:allophanate hydrolase n=1 Tax=Pararhizobium sp. TaxID=1977563 RepID=UPI003BA8AD6A
MKPQRSLQPEVLATDDRHSEVDFYRNAYAAGLDPANIILNMYDQILEAGLRPVWISLLPIEYILSLVEQAKARKAAGAELPLFGIPFAVKDNIDVAGVSTTAGCPEFSYVPEKNAFVIDRLIAAGAIPIGKTNLDQFATGLNGTRSPYGIPACVFDERYISGGSSSGSAVAVARGLVAFSLGTDTAGSGRIPAALNNLVGVKPTRGLLSNNGLVPAARSLDCISVFARTIDDAMLVADIASSYDPDDPFSRTAPEKAKSAKQWSAPFTVGIPAKEHLEFFGDAQAESLFDDMVQRIERLGATWVTFDYTPFKLAAEMLYAGPWVAERLVAIDNFATENTEAIHPVVRGIILSGKSMSAVDAFKGQYRLAELTREAEATWQKIDVMLLPTTPTTYTIDAMLADPVRLNSNLGLYTNFVNLMDLSAIAFPAGMRTNGLPFGVSLIGRAFDDAAIAELGKLLMGELPVRSIVDTADTRQLSENAELIPIAVVGAHLSGQPLNHQLTERGGRLLRAARTAPGYAFYALGDTMPAKPGLIRDQSAAGLIELEIWELPAITFGSFVNAIPAPLGVGTVALEDGSHVKGFLCEPHAVAGAEDITRFGGWRAYRSSLQ